MVKTYGGRGAEGAENGVFNVPVSEVIYWKKFRETSFWDEYVGVTLSC